MIKLELVIHNPWSRGNFADKWNKTWRITAHKAFEAQWFKYGYDYLGFRVDTAWRGRDHAGPEFELVLFGHTLSLRLYDSRHWDYDNRCWLVYNEEDTCQN